MKSSSNSNKDVLKLFGSITMKPITRNLKQLVSIQKDSEGTISAAHLLHGNFCSQMIRCRNASNSSTISIFGNGSSKIPQRSTTVWISLMQDLVRNQHPCGHHYSTMKSSSSTRSLNMVHLLPHTLKNGMMLWLTIFVTQL